MLPAWFPHGLHFYLFLDLSVCLQMMSAIKSGAVAYSRFARMAEMQEAVVEKEGLMKKVSVERSGGGV